MSAPDLRVVALKLFAHLVRRPEEEIDLFRAALLLAEPSYPGLDIAHYVAALDALGQDAVVALAGGDETPTERVGRLLRFLFEDKGFAGNEADYYDPRNSFLNEVIDRRTGIPITLSIVFIEVAARVGIHAMGVAFPGHFIVRVNVGRDRNEDGDGRPVFVDAFHGRVLAPADLRALQKSANGSDHDPDPRVLQPAGKVQILIRMLNNLRAIYQSRGDMAGQLYVLERLQILAPQDAEVDRALRRIEHSGDEDSDPSRRN